jgi:hypothetical protein
MYPSFDGIEEERKGVDVVVGATATTIISSSIVGMIS